MSASWRAAKSAGLETWKTNLLLRLEKLYGDRANFALVCFRMLIEILQCSVLLMTVFEMCVGGCYWRWFVITRINK